MAHLEAEKKMASIVPHFTYRKCKAGCELERDCFDENPATFFSIVQIIRRKGRSFTLKKRSLCKRVTTKLILVLSLKYRYESTFLGSPDSEMKGVLLGFSNVSRETRPYGALPSSPRPCWKPKASSRRILGAP
jgi:hypothetical protein